jgi:hypothetical protein
MNGRDLVKRFFRRQPTDRIPFLPIAFYQASRIDGAPGEELIAEPPRLCRAVIELSRLIGSDGIAVRFDGAVLAACGADLSWPNRDGPPAGEPTSPPDAAALTAIAEPLIESIAALKAELRGAKAIVAVMHGPAALSARLGVEHEAGLGAALRALADAACKAGAEVLVVEDDPGADAARFKRLVGPIVNTGRYYTASVVVSSPSAIADRLADGQIVPSTAFPEAPALFATGALADAEALFDVAARTQLAANLAAASGFLSIDDRAMIGREIADVTSAIDALLGRS